MITNEVKQIFIGPHLVGIVGLADAIKAIAADCQGHNDDDIRERLLEKIALNNYIPAAARAAYGKAVLREFKLARGLSVEPEDIACLRIAVLGMGCTRCDQLESDVRDVLSEMKIAADLQHITDIREIARFKIMGSPALVINDKVLSVGEVPPKSKIRQWIIEEYNEKGIISE
jgi:hypothetical protein